MSEKQYFRDIHNMQLHQDERVSFDVHCMRVASGWIYTTYLENGVSQVFVPLRT